MSLEATGVGKVSIAGRTLIHGCADDWGMLRNVSGRETKLGSFGMKN